VPYGGGVQGGSDFRLLAETPSGGSRRPSGDSPHRPPDRVAHSTGPGHRPTPRDRRSDGRPMGRQRSLATPASRPMAAVGRGSSTQPPSAPAGPSPDRRTTTPDPGRAAAPAARRHEALPGPAQAGDSYPEDADLPLREGAGVGRPESPQAAAPTLRPVRASPLRLARPRRLPPHRRRTPPLHPLGGRCEPSRALGSEFDSPTAAGAIATPELARRQAASWGLAIREVNTDRGSQFFANKGAVPSSESTQFGHFLQAHGIRHVVSRVNHPQTHGKLERL
jgi:hypothetical protein